MVPDNELEHHLVLCTASHSCHERLTTFNRSLKQLAFKIRRRKHGLHHQREQTPAPDIYLISLLSQDADIYVQSVSARAARRVVEIYRNAQRIFVEVRRNAWRDAWRCAETGRRPEKRM
eukprot:4650580-Pleurochrysis_carterae.AAC.1